MGATSSEVLRNSASTEDGRGGNPAGVVLDERQDTVAVTAAATWLDTRTAPVAHG